MVVHLRTLRCKVGNGGLGGRERQAPFIGPLMNPGCLACEGWGCITVATGGDGVGEVVCV